MTNLDLPAKPKTLIDDAWWPRALRTVALGTLGGCALGIVARGWMRLISDDPGFSWSGTIFIVTGFTIFGLGQSIVAVARTRTERRRTLTMVRVIGVVTMLPLFVAAGAVMLPTVVGGGLAVARREWRSATRLLCLVAAAGPVVFVGLDLADTFGRSARWMIGFALMLGTYAAIIWATRFTLCAQQDGWRMSRRSKFAMLVGVGLAGLALVASTVGVG